MREFREFQRFIERAFKNGAGGGVEYRDEESKRWFERWCRWVRVNEINRMLGWRECPWKPGQG